MEFNEICILIAQINKSHINKLLQIFGISINKPFLKNKLRNVSFLLHQPS